MFLPHKSRAFPFLKGWAQVWPRTSTFMCYPSVNCIKLISTIISLLCKTPTKIIDSLISKIGHRVIQQCTYFKMHVVEVREVEQRCFSCRENAGKVIWFKLNFFFFENLVHTHPERYVCSGVSVDIVNTKDIPQWRDISWKIINICFIN